MLAAELLLVLCLILLNGFLAMSELAVVSARRTRLAALVKEGRRGARRALLLAENPGRFLSTVQIGITLVGVLAGAFGGARIAGPLADRLAAAGVSVDLAEPLALGAVVAVIAYLSLILGELVPKQLALGDPERIALFVAPPMRILSRIASPLVWLLDRSARLVLAVFGRSAHRREAVSEEEIKALVAEAELAGVVEPAETRMITAVMRLGDRSVRAVMTPRREVDWVDLDAGEERIRQAIRTSPHSRLPAAHGTIDAVAGIVRTKDLLDACLDGRTVDAKAAVVPAPVIHDQVDALDAFEQLKASAAHIAIVVDEYGTLEGVVTTADILEAIAGALGGPGEDEHLHAHRREDGSWLLDGAMPIDVMAEAIGFPLPAGADYHTVAGFLLWHFKRVPAAGDSVDIGTWRFEVMDMDGRRIDKVLAARRAGRR
jgi:putative hemolysin